MGTHALARMQVFEQPLSVDHEIPDEGELRHGFEGDDIAVVGGVFIEQARAALADLAIDDH